MTCPMCESIWVSWMYGIKSEPIMSDPDITPIRPLYHKRIKGYSCQSCQHQWETPDYESKILPNRQET